MFIIGAVVVVISLFTLSESLTRPSDFDPSDVQGNDAAIKYFGVVNSINQTLMSPSTTDQNRDDNLQRMLFFLEGEFSKDQAFVHASYGVPSLLPLKVNIELRSENFVLNKTEIFRWPG